MRSHQRGATFLGMLIIIVIVGFALYAGIRLTPLYIEYMAVGRAMEQTAEEFSGESATAQQLRISLQNRFSIDDVKSLPANDVEIKKADRGYSLRAWYRAEAPFVANVFLVVEFDKTVVVSQ